MATAVPQHTLERSASVAIDSNPTRRQLRVHDRVASRAYSSYPILPVNQGKQSPADIARAPWAPISVGLGGGIPPDGQRVGHIGGRNRRRDPALTCVRPTGRGPVALASPVSVPPAHVSARAPCHCLPRFSCNALPNHALLDQGGALPRRSPDVSGPALPCRPAGRTPGHTARPTDQNSSFRRTTGRPGPDHAYQVLGSAPGSRVLRERASWSWGS